MARGRSALVGALLLLTTILVVFGYLIAHSQAEARRDLEKRFRDRAVVSAALTQSVFTSLQSSPPAPALAAPKVSRAALERIAAQGRSPYIVVRDARGAVLAATRSAPPVARAPAIAPELRPALAGHSALSGVIPGRTPAASVVEWAIPFRAPSGPRVEIIGIHSPLLGKFLSGFLAQLPAESRSSAAVIDRAGRVVGSPDRGTSAASIDPDRAVLAALRTGRAGDYTRDRTDRYFASAPVKGTAWRVVLAADQSRLYSEINGSRRTVPWLVLVLLGLAGLGGILALRRSAVAQAEIERRTITRRAALEINDNVIQRLAVVKFALERGQDAATEEKLTEALQEAQRLVNQLLGEDDQAQAGSLRRTEEAPARL